VFQMGRRKEDRRRKPRIYSCPGQKAIKQLIVSQLRHPAKGVCASNPESCSSRPETQSSELPEPDAEFVYSAHHQRVHDSAELWDHHFAEFVTGFGHHFSPTVKCILCHGNTSENSYRCLQCDLMTVCLPCLQHQHRHSPPHLVQRWNGSFYETQATSAILKCNCEMDSNTVPVTLFLFDGQLVEASVCSCDVRGTLLRNGFWPLQPGGEQSIRRAVHIRALLLLDAVQLQCGASLWSACNALRDFRNSLWEPRGAEMYRALNSFGAFAAFRRVLSVARWPELPNCPACFVGGVSSKPLFLLLDACFGMKHKVTANSGHSVQAEAGYFITPDIESNVTAADDSCANWRAGRGESLLSASQHRLYDVFGLFSGICRHGSVVMLEDLVTPGEKLNYAKSMVHNFLSGLPSSCKAIISYDVACKLSSHFHQDERLRFAVPAFHAYGHTAACQLKSGIRATEGAGLTDGEAVERFWSELRPITKQTKEMTKRNRQDFLNFVCSSRNLALVFKIGLWLIERQRLQAKTLRYLEGASGDATKIDDEAERILEIYEANQAASRQRTRDKEATIKFLHVQACDREFLSRYLLTSRGQKMAAHLRNVINKSLASSKTHVKNYNQDHLEAPLDFESVRYPSSSAFNELPSDVCHAIQAIKHRNLQQRLQEEEDLCSEEVRRVTKWMEWWLNFERFDNFESCLRSVDEARRHTLRQLLKQHGCLFPSEAPVIDRILADFPSMNSDHDKSETESTNSD
ncbi:hypothetical protein BOX15_Mlig019149g2, partial [Macrostomum lignano]